MLRLTPAIDAAFAKIITDDLGEFGADYLTKQTRHYLDSGCAFGDSRLTEGAFLELFTINYVGIIAPRLCKPAVWR